MAILKINDKTIEENSGVSYSSQLQAIGIYHPHALIDGFSVHCFWLADQDENICLAVRQSYGLK
jgi:hypothetical protein